MTRGGNSGNPISILRAGLLENSMQYTTIHYTVDSYTTTGANLVGRQSASNGFLRTAAQSGASRLVCYIGSRVLI